jgi:hypothetical protein
VIEGRFETLSTALSSDDPARGADSQLLMLNFAIPSAGGNSETIIDKVKEKL